MIHLELNVDQVNLILAVLAKVPYETSAGLIGEIRAQAIPQIPQPQAEETQPE